MKNDDISILINNMINKTKEIKIDINYLMMSKS